MDYPLDCTAAVIFSVGGCNAVLAHCYGTTGSNHGNGAGNTRGGFDYNPSFGKCLVVVCFVLV
jgi:hypothetical protein